MNAKKVLILLTHKFPIPQSEVFLWNELPYMHYDRICIVPMTGYPDPKLQQEMGNPDISVFNCGNSLKFPCGAKWWLIALCQKTLWQEFCHILRCKKWSFDAVKRLIRTTAYGERVIATVKKAIFAKSQDQQFIVYAYWMTSLAYAAIKLRNNHKSCVYAFSRCHGHDLYAYRYRNDYIEYQEFFLKNLDMVAAIAENGKVYLQNRFGEKNCKNVSIERLGTLDHSVQKEADGPFTIISCSSVIRIKRLERLIDALAAIHDFSVRWIHYGDGPLMERIKSYAREKIGAMPNIEFVFAGYKDNAGLMRLYGEHYYHILVNTSETEGIPVSIMEALSFGIPVIATDVGGCAEIVKDQYCGFIIPKDFRTEELTSKITLIHAMPPRAYRQLRAAARAQWQNYYSAEKNYLSLHEMLLSHFDINN